MACAAGIATAAAAGTAAPAAAAVIVVLRPPLFELTQDVFHLLTSSERGWSRVGAKSPAGIVHSSLRETRYTVEGCENALLLTELSDGLGGLPTFAFHRTGAALGSVIDTFASLVMARSVYFLWRYGGS